MVRYVQSRREKPGKAAVLGTCLLVGLIGGIVGCSCLYGETSGLKYFRNYPPGDYIIQPQNWGVVQDRRGIIYAANQGGVLEYDGVSWKRIMIPNQVVRSLAVDDKGTVYVGGLGELGYLGPDPQGQLKYISLTAHLEEERKNFGSVWKTHATPGGVFFRTSRYLFRWDPVRRQMTVALASKQGEADKFNGSFCCGGRYFINQRSVGLRRLENDSFNLIPGGERFAFIKTVFMVAPYDDSGEKLLIGTREEGFFIYDGKGVKPLDTEVAVYLKENKASHGIGLVRSPGRFAVATLRGGLVVADRQGEIRYRFSKEFGLLDNNAKYVFEDNRGNLWLALNKGIARIEYASPLSIYDDHTDLPGLVHAVSRHAGGLYAGTSDGLFYLAPGARTFRSVTGMDSWCWSLLSIGDSLLAATSTGVYQIYGSTVRKITGTKSYILQQSRQDPRRVWVGMNYSLASLYHTPHNRQEQWTEEHIYKKVDREIRTVVEDRQGNLWLGVLPSGVLKVDFAAKGEIAACTVNHYNTSHRLPEGAVQVFWAAGHVCFGSRQGLFRFHRGKGVFLADDTLAKGPTAPGGLRDVFCMREDGDGTIWFHALGRNYRAVPRPDHSYGIQPEPLARIPIAAQVNFIYPDPLDQATWFASHEGLIRYDPVVERNYEQEYSTVIRRVQVNGSPQFFDFRIPLTAPHPLPVFDYKNRNLHFEFAAPFFEDESRTRYRCLLEGYDRRWSDWQRASQVDYTNLDAGTYTFRVSARNVYGLLSREAIFRFKVRPPWYLTWWAFVLYVLLFFLTVFLSVRWRSMKLKLEKQKLEQVVKERAREIHEKNQQLEKQTRLLIDQAEKLKELDHAKSRFFANISHEFRTPLTLIIGPLERLLAGPFSEEAKNRLDLIHQNAHRLLTLINRLLELSRIDSGKMKLAAAPQDIVSFLKGLLSSFEHLARQSGLNLTFRGPAEPVTLYFDAEKMEGIFGNLLSNAVKFTPKGGDIMVSVKQVMEPGEDFPAGWLEISVRDTGIGIAKEQLAHIFDRFYQVESHESYRRKHRRGGSGIGLALTRELVALHHGKIDVHSKEGGRDSGSEFILRFPLGKAHLEPDDIAVGSPETRIPERVRAEEVHEGEIPVEAGQSRQDTGRPTVLVVEDNAQMRRFIRESIESRYTVVEAEDGRTGIHQALETMPDLIVSDIMMPEVDGYELCRTLKADFKTSHIPIILLTAKASQGSQVQGLETGADDYITKPFSTTILLSRIKNIIDQRRRLQERIRRQTLLEPEEIEVSSIDQRFLKQLHKIIEKELSDPDLNVEALSEKMDISRVTLNKKILALSGETATDFIRSYRLKRAKQLLEADFGTVTDVAFEVGFSSSAYFTRCFREKFHRLPSAYLGKTTT
jgi:signal transduction histidine kinase/DNA-binding response OmpR family regulator